MKLLLTGFALLCLVSPASSSGQQPSQTTPSTGLIIGRVADGDTNAPISGALVSLSGAGIRPQRVIVDPQGRFMFAGLPSGAFTINATRTGYLDGTYGRVRSDGSGRTLDLTPGERATDAVVRLWRFASISGRVLDDAGDPVSFVRVQALTRTLIAGRWRLSNTGLGADVDERGVYRIAGLTHGDYALLISSMTYTIPSSLLSAADLERRSPAGLLSDLRAKGTMGLANDLMQGFGIVKVGDLMLQTSAERTAPMSGDGRSIEGYPAVWYPNASVPGDATIISLRPGEERAGIDLHPILTKMFRVSGMVTGPDGPVSHLALSLVPARLDETAAEITGSLATSMYTARSASDANGAFTFLAVPPGQYIIRTLTTPPPIPDQQPSATVVRTADGMSSAISSGPPLPPMVPAEQTLWANVPVSVGGGDTTGVSVTLRAGLRVRGLVEFSGAAAQPDARALRAIRLSMDPADGRTIALPSSYQAQIYPPAIFYTIGLLPGRYVLRADNLPRGWSLKSASVAGRDISDMPLTLDTADVDGLVLTFTDRPASLSGTVRDAQARHDPNATVLIFPTDGVWSDRGPNPRRFRSARVGRSGEYSATALPPGDYFIVAVNDANASNWQEPAFLQRLSKLATRITLGDGQTLSTALTTERIQR
jgi:hypothetical protein